MRVAKGGTGAGRHRVPMQGASDPRPHKASEDHTASAPDLDFMPRKGIPGEEGPVRAEVGLGCTGEVFLESWGSGTGGRSPEQLFYALEPRSVT